MNAEQFIENNYHTRAGLEADKLIEDKTGIEVSFEQIAEAYHKYMMKEIESLPDEKKKCPKCNSEHWYLRDQFDDIKICRNCGNKF